MGSFENYPGKDAPRTRRELREMLAVRAALENGGSSQSRVEIAARPGSVSVANETGDLRPSLTQVVESGMDMRDELGPAEFELESKERRRRTTPWLKWSLIGSASVLLVAVAIAGVYVTSLWNTFANEVELISEEDLFAPDEERPAELEGVAKNAQTLLLLGSDTRGAIGGIDDIEGRSDTIMVVHIPANREDIVVMSIMRDNWVEIPGKGMNKINSAMQIGGIPLVVKTVEGFIGTRIDHVAVVDFEGFKGLSTALGGVTVDNPRAFYANGTTREYFKEGKISLKGESALAFVRERKAFIDGDYTRVKNQQLFIKAVFNKVMSVETLTNPARISEVVSSVAPYLKVDKGIDLPYIVSLAFELRDLRASDITFFTSPTLGTGREGNQSIVRVDWKSVEKLRAAFRDGTLVDFAATVKK
jgi:LCP family protein required for cell wall assembly